MLEHKKIQNLSDYFVELNSRREKGVYFYRINGYSEEVGEFIKKYYDTARRTGVVIEGKIPNPDEGNLAYYNEIMGMDFQMSMDFIHVSLRKWLPRMNEFQRQNVAASIYDSLDSLRKAGKTENMLRNAYIKFMCWLYYKFERIVNQLGENHIPKILYEGQISNYELMLISILSNAGCDVVLLQYAGDQGYLKTDPGSVLSDSLQMEGLQPFPQGYCVKKVRDEIQNELNNERLYGIRPSLTNCTNAWIKGNGLDDIRESILLRGNDSRFFYNCFCRINGATGFGGALKNIGMGCGSRAGKMKQHASGKPAVNEELCRGCRRCAKECGSDAITYPNKKAVIDYDKCKGCGRCIGACGFDAVYNPNSSANELLDRKMAEYAQAVCHGRPHFHVALVQDISPNCDCHGENDAPILPDIGMFASFDPVALDQACADACLKATPIENSQLGEHLAKPDWHCHHDHFKDSNPNIEWQATLDQAEKIGLGTRQYELKIVK